MIRCFTIPVRQKRLGMIETKDASHRGKALKKLAKMLPSLMDLAVNLIALRENDPLDWRKQPGSAPALAQGAE
jgi:hypothetical protein